MWGEIIGKQTEPQEPTVTVSGSPTVAWTSEGEV